MEIIKKSINFLCGAIYYVLGIIFILFSMLSFEISAISTPEPSFMQNNTLVVSLTIGAIVATLGFIYLLHILNKKINISDKKIISVSLILSIIVQLLFILLFPTNASHDTLIIQDIAHEILKGDFSAFRVGEYLSSYPNNVGITLYLALVFKFFNYTLAPRLLNIVFTTITIVYFAKLLNRLSSINFAKTLALLCLFPVPYMLNNFVYGDIPSLCFGIMGLYYLYEYLSDRKMRHIVLSVICLMTSYFLRSTGMLIILIAIAVVLLHNNSKLTTKFIIATILATLLINIPLQITDKILVATKKIDVSIFENNQPTFRWINMGYPGEQLGYWDGGEATKEFKETFNSDKDAYNKHLQNEFAQKLTNDLSYTIKQYAKKIFWTWTEGTYQVNFYALKKIGDPPYLYKTIGSEIIQNNKSVIRYMIVGFLRALNSLFLLLSGLYLIISARKKDFRLIGLVLLLLVFAGFYVIWEIKSRYIYPCSFILVGFSICFLNIYRNNCLKKKKKEN